MITLTGLRKVFTVDGRPVSALDGIDLEVPDGSIHGIVGHSGAGKSTLIRCLTGLDRPTSGTVRIGDRVISELTDDELRQARRRIGMVFQHVNLLDSRTAAENVALPLEVAGVSRSERRRRVAELLDTVGLAHRSGNYPAQLSGGEKQRVGIARALATEPEVLLFDEPTSALDSVSTRQVLQLIGDLRDRLGITTLVITHEMSVVRQICDSVTLLAGGRIVQTGSMADIMRRPGSPLAKELIPLPPSSLDDASSLIEVTLSGDGISPEEVLGMLAGRDLGADIVAGTIETLGGRRVGRFQLDLRKTGGESVARALDVLDGAGVYAEVVA